MVKKLLIGALVLVAIVASPVLYFGYKLLQSGDTYDIPGIEVTGSAGYGWANDPFAKGTWCTWRPEWYRKYGDGLRDEPEGRIYFGTTSSIEPRILPSTTRTPTRSIPERQAGPC